jgi:hypothetical protein
MGRNAIVISLAALAGCSFVDDFDKFQAAENSALPGEDAGQAGLEDAATDATGQVRNDAATPVRDAAMEDASATVIDGSAADAAVVDAYVPPPPPCGGVVCDDGDTCTRDTCESNKCVYKPIDADGDGFAPGTCKPGSIATGGDCDDSKNAIKPSASEVCDGLDNNCNGMVDEGLAKIQCYPDTDGDEFPNLDGKPVAACNKCPNLTIAVQDASKRELHDCYDSPEHLGKEVYPGQTNWQSEGYGPGSKSERKWDYDCSGTVETELQPLNGGCLGLLGLVCDSSQGFVGDDIPACGETGPFQICRQNGLSCTGSTESRQQRCK